MPRRILVTSALPYANGPIHFGHLVGAYLPADVFCRYHRLIGSDVLFICGTDEHGVAITVKAEKEGRGYQEYVDHWHREIERFFQRFNVAFDWFGQTSRRDPHYPLSLEFFLRLLRNGRIVPKDSQQHYCPKCARFLPDRYVEGTCYLCGAERARGDECKKCGAWLEAIKLIDPFCSTCGSKPEIRTVTQWELQLQGFPTKVGGTPDDTPGGRALQRWFDRFATRENLKTNVYSTVVTKLVEQEGLRGRPITRDLAWGVPLSDLPPGTVPGLTPEQAKEKVLYVWFDAPIGYVSATIEWARAVAKDEARWRDWWLRPAGDDAGATRLLHFIGKDNIPFHCIVFPAMLAWQEMDAGGVAGIEQTLGRVIGPRAGEAYVLPENVPANEFFNLEGRKFNTSDGWYVDLEEFFASYDPDAARFALCRTMPETADSDFTWREFQARTNELADQFGNFASRVLGFTERFLGNVVPAGGPDSAGGAEAAEARAAGEQVGALIEAYRFRDAADRFLEVAREANRYFAAQEPWKTRKTDPDACAAAIRRCLRLLAVLAGLAAPFVPATAARLWSMLGLAGAPRWPGSFDPAALLPVGHALGKVGVLVAKITDDQVAAETAKLQKR
jgi:methionyl-tRNA synthetase